MNGFVAYGYMTKNPDGTISKITLECEENVSTDK
jgi:hypothetical protein